MRLLVERALQDTERGYGKLEVQLDEDALEHLIRVAGGDARNALNALELAVESTPAGRGWVLTHHPGGSPGIDPAPGGALRQGRGCSLRYHLGLHQIGARFRPGCRPLLAGQDAVCRGRPALYPAPPDHPGRRGYRPGRSAGTGGSQRRGPGFRLYRPARRHLSHRRSHPLPGDCAEIKHRHSVFQSLPSDRSKKASPPFHATCRTATGTPVPWGMVRATSIPHEAPITSCPSNTCPQPLLGTYFYAPSEQGYEAQVVDRLARWREAQRLALGITRTEDVPDLSQQAVQELKQKHKPSGAL